MLKPGDQAGRFRVLSPLGEGGMGIVFIAEDPALERRVALKVLRGEHGEKPETISRFFNEARVVNRIHHEHIVEVTELGQLPSGESYYVMELLEGRSLRSAIGEGPLPVQRVLHVAEQMCDALAAAHHVGVVHRDLKPDNVFLISRSGDPDYVKVLDFGIAKLLRPDPGPSDTPRTRTGAVLGTAAYMSPEQAMGVSPNVDGRSDIYALGIMLFEMLTGQRPFESHGWGALLLMHLQDPFPSLRERRADVPAGLEAIVNRATAKKPEDRWPSMNDLRQALVPLIDDAQQQVRTRRTPLTPPAVRVVNPVSPTAATHPGSPAVAPRAASGWTAAATLPPDAVALPGTPTPATVGPSTASHASGEAVHAPVKPARRWPLAVAFLGVALLAASGYAVLATRTRTSTSAKGRASIAVLPFVNLGADPAEDYFGEGLATELLQLLARIPDLRVIARTSSFAFKGQKVDIATVARKLKVTHVLEGTVRKAGKRVRIDAQLIRAEDSSRIWSDRFDRTLDDVFTLQDEIAQAVVGQLQVTLLGKALASRAGAKNPEAYNLWLQGRYFAERQTRDDLGKAVGYYRQGLALAPTDALLWAGLSSALARQAYGGHVAYETGYPEARKAADQAVLHDPRLAAGHVARARIDHAYAWDWGRAGSQVQRALELDPQSAEALEVAGNLALTLGRYEEARGHFQRILDRDPLAAAAHHSLGLALYYGGRLPEAERAFRRVLDLHPRRPESGYQLGRVLLAQVRPALALEAISADPDWRKEGLPLAHHALGQKAEADRALAELVRSSAAESPYQIAEVHAYRGDLDPTFEWLDRALARRDPGLCFIKGDPLLEKVRADPRYAALLGKLNLAP